MEKKRLFCGCFIDLSPFKDIYLKLKDNFNSCLSGKWVEYENLHFTVKFLGEVDIITIPQLQSSLKGFLNWNESPILISNLSTFPNIDRCRVLHIAVTNPDRYVFKIFKSIERIAAGFGFEAEKKTFSPHITLCRVKSLDPSKFNSVFDEFRNIKIGTIPRFKIDLIESKLTPLGPIYKKLGN
jgi:RNA 2',3'-cyclic 3'-phosphodiesterase